MTVRRVTAAVALVAALALGACGGGSDTRETAAVQAGAQHDQWTYARGLFNRLCAGCHTLADAGANGKRYDLEESGLVSILDTVPQRIALARGAILDGEADAHGSGVAMPAWRGVLSRKEVDALASYVGTVVREPTDAE